MYILSETSTCIIGDPSETDMPQYVIPIYINKQKVYKNKNLNVLKLEIIIRRHLGRQWAFQSPMEHLGLQRVSDQACQSSSDGAGWSPMGHVDLRWGMSVSDEACRGLRSNMSISNMSSMGLRLVSGGSPMDL